MVIQVKRNTFTTASTCGEMWVDGVFECYTLEDEMREKEGIPWQHGKSRGSLQFQLEPTM
jgi:hypothetical protein